MVAPTAISVSAAPRTTRRTVSGAIVARRSSFGVNVARVAIRLVSLVGKSFFPLFLLPCDIAWYHAVNTFPGYHLLFHILLSSARARICSSGDVIALTCSIVYGGGGPRPILRGIVGANLCVSCLTDEG